MSSALPLTELPVNCASFKRGQTVGVLLACWKKGCFYFCFCCCSYTVNVSICTTFPAHLSKKLFQLRHDCLTASMPTERTQANQGMGKVPRLIHGTFMRPSYQKTWESSTKNSQQAKWFQSGFQENCKPQDLTNVR